MCEFSRSWKYIHIKSSKDLSLCGGISMWMSEKIMPFPNDALSKKGSNIWIYQLLSRLNHLFLPNQLCLPFVLHIKPNICPKQLKRRKGEITVQEGICYLKCILVASSTVPPSKSLTGHVESSPLLPLPHKKSEYCPFKCTTEEEAGVYLAGGNSILHAWHTATIGIQSRSCYILQGW